MNPFRLCFLLMVLPFSSSAQPISENNYSKSFSFSNENDAYLLQKKDAYYTNGFFFRLTKAGERKGKKIVRSLQLSQKIYTPLIRKTTGPEDIDRPYCGYLYLGYQQTVFPQNNAILQTRAALGIVGGDSFGEDVQNGYHKLLRYAPFNGWQYQVRNALGIDLGFSYAQTLWQDSSWIQWVPQVEANLGTTFTNASIGSYLCVGSFERHSNSALWDARIQKKQTLTRRNHELFIYWHPQFIFQAYNATIEGGLFSKGEGAVLGESSRIMFQQNWGLCYAKGRWTTRLEIVYQSREAVAQTLPQRYASFQLSYALL